MLWTVRFRPRADRSHWKCCDPAQGRSPVGPGSGSVGNLEFFDLVFVYAMAQLTELVRDDVSWRGFGHGVLGLLAVWWAWVCHN